MAEPQRDQLFATARDALLAAFPDVQAIYVYGSFARGEEWPGSDIDLAILREAGATPWDRLEMGAELAARLQREVDLVDLRAASDVLRREVLESGRLLYAADPQALLEWEAGALTRYGHYREEVRDLLAELNVIRAFDTAIDLANMVIRARRLGIPAATRESFLILGREKLIDQTLAQQLAKMVGFRNLAVHQYQELDLNIVESVIRVGLDDLLTFAEAVRGVAPDGRRS